MFVEKSIGVATEAMAFGDISTISASEGVTEVDVNEPIEPKDSIPWEAVSGTTETHNIVFTPKRVPVSRPKILLEHAVVPQVIPETTPVVRAKSISMTEQIAQLRSEVKVRARKAPSDPMPTDYSQGPAFLGIVKQRAMDHMRNVHMKMLIEKLRLDHTKGVNQCGSEKPQYGYEQPYEGLMATDIHHTLNQNIFQANLGMD